MSRRENAVTSTLVANNSTLLAAGNTLEDLANGQMGLFNEKGESFIQTIGTVPENFFIAVKGPDGEVTKTSAGQFIEKSSVLAPIHRRNYVAGSPMTATVSGYKPLFDTTYGIKVNFKNSHIERLFGNVNINKTFMVKTRPMNGADTDEDRLDPNQLTLDFVKEIENNGDDTLSVEIVSDQDITATNVSGISSNISAGDVVNETQVNALIAHNKANPNSVPLTTGIKLTPEPSPIGERLGGINIQYHKLLQTKIVVSLIGNLNTGSTSVTSTGITFEQGNGEDVMQKEYLSAPVDQGVSPYRVSPLTCLPRGDIKYFADKNEQYTQFVIDYQPQNVEGSLSYTQSFTTCIAIPSGSGLVDKINTFLSKIATVNRVGIV